MITNELIEHDKPYAVFLILYFSKKKKKKKSEKKNIALDWKSYDISVLLLPHYSRLMVISVITEVSGCN